MKNTKLTKDGFLWLLIARKQAESLFESKAIEIYSLFDDDSESLIEELSDLDRSSSYGIEVGWINDLVPSMCR